MVDPSQGEAELRGGAAALPAASAPPPGFDDAFTRLTLLMCWLCLGYFYGMSPLVLPVAEAFGEDDTVMGGVFLYGSSLMFLVTLRYLRFQSDAVIPSRASSAEAWSPKIC